MSKVSYEKPGVGERILKLRTRKGLSQRDISAPGISYAYISRVEQGHRNMSLQALMVVAEKLGTTALYLLTGRHNNCPFCKR